LGECPERQRGRTVNPLRKLRRFESYFPHQTSTEIPIFFGLSQASVAR
jgi:hypothetical protein